MLSDEHLRAALEHTAAGLRAPLEASLRAFGDDLLGQAAAERERAARDAAEAAAAEVRQQAEAQLLALRQSADQQISEIHRSAQEQIDSTRHALEAELADAHSAAEAEFTALREKADAEAALRLKADAEIAEVRQQSAAHAAVVQDRADAEIEDARRTAQAQVEDVQRALDERLAGARRELDDARRALDDARRALEGARHGSEDLRRQLDRARSEMDEVRARSAEEAQALVAVQLAAASESHQRRLTEGIARARNDVRDSAVMEARTVLEGIRSLDEARSLGDVLDRLVQIHRRDLERIAVFVVRGDRLREWRAAGFPERESSERMDLGIAEGGVAAEAVRTGAPAMRAADDGPALSGSPAGAEGRAAAALPVTVGGAVVAVLYVDAPRPEPFLDVRWPAMFEVLARHASRVLEGITIQRAAGLLPPAGAAIDSQPGRAFQ